MFTYLTCDVGCCMLTSLTIPRRSLLICVCVCVRLLLIWFCSCVFSIAYCCLALICDRGVPSYSFTFYLLGMFLHYHYLMLPSPTYIHSNDAKLKKNRGSYMSAHVLLNSFKELEKRDKLTGLSRICILFCNERH